VEHVLMRCSKFKTERNELTIPLRISDRKIILIRKQGCKAAVRMIPRTKLLEQFKNTSKEMSEVPSRKAPACVCTTPAAKGLDWRGISSLRLATALSTSTSWHAVTE
jgi:hypothetical protein